MMNPVTNPVPINLLPWRQIKKSKQCYQWVFFISSLLTVMLGIQSFIFIKDKASLQSMLNAEKAMVGKILKIKKQQQNDLTMIQEIKKAELSYDKVYKNRYILSQVAKVVANTIPQDISLSIFSYQEPKIFLSGLCQKNQMISDWMHLLHSRLKMKVTLNDVEKVSDGYHFSMVLKPYDTL